MREPLPLHRLPADPGRRLRTGYARRGRRLRGPPRVARRRRSGTPGSPSRTASSSGRPACPRPPPLLGEHPDAVLVAGSTDWGVEVNIRGIRAAYAIAVDRLPELRGFEVGEDWVELGAALTLTEIERRLDGRIPLLDHVFPQFASRLIRNGATIGGNLGTGSPIGDTPPALLALEAVLVLASTDGEREVPLAEYFTGYRQSVRRPGELIKSVRIPLPLAEISAFHKIAKRRFDDISSVALGFAIDVVDGEVVEARIGLGGVAATPIRALDTEAALEGRPWSRETVRVAAGVLRQEGTPIDDMRASADYRVGDARHLAPQALRPAVAVPSRKGSTEDERPVRTSREPRCRRGDPARECLAARHRVWRSTPTTWWAARRTACTHTPCRSSRPTRR